jgi:hypothetical protein
MTQLDGQSLNPGPPPGAPPVQAAGVNRGWLWVNPKAQGIAGMPLDVVDFTPPCFDGRLSLIAGSELSALQRLGQAFINFLRALLKLILTAALIVLVGAALYYGLPYLKNTFIAPVEENTARIEGLASEVAADREEIVALQTQLEAVNGRIDTIEKTIETHSASLVQLEDVQAALEKQMTDGDDELERIDSSDHVVRNRISFTGVVYLTEQFAWRG